MVGGLPGYRQQDAVHGLPLQLSPEEVTLCVARGWADLYAVRDKKITVMASANGTGARPGSPPAQKNPKPPAPSKAWGAKPKIAHNAKRVKGNDETTHEPWSGVLRQKRVQIALTDDWEEEINEEGRRVATTGAELFETNTGGTNQNRVGMDETTVTMDTTTQKEEKEEQEKEKHASSIWTYPRTPSQSLRFCAFAALHARGVTLTSGAKFGADYLAYPGDPAAYHASFTVRVMDGSGEEDASGNAYGAASSIAGTDASIAAGTDGGVSSDTGAFRADREISLLSLVAATRMAHGARKHCVLAGGVKNTEGTDLAGIEPGATGHQANAQRTLQKWNVSFVTVTPDVEQSSQRRGRAGN